MVGVRDGVGVCAAQVQSTAHCSSAHTIDSPATHVRGGAAGGQVEVPVAVGVTGGVGVFVAHEQLIRHR